MRPRSILVIAWLAIAASAAPKWVRVTAPHFVVTSDGSLSDARHVAGQLERMREVFHEAFPGLRDPAAPLEVLAVADRREFEALEPASYLGKGKLELAGYFQRAQEHNLILLRLDTNDSDHPYRVVYHEYTHLLTLGGGQVMPVWLSEGLAQFYESTEVNGNTASIGKFEDFNLQLLRERQLVPVATIFAVGPDSPYYREQSKGDIFYAESWALTHMLMMRQRQHHSHELDDYLALLRQNVDSVAAAARAFGDLAALQQQLDQYTRHQSYVYVNLPLSGKVNEKQFAMVDIPQSSADAERGEFLAYVGRFDDATKLLQQVLASVSAADPAGISADESLGYIASRQNKLEQAAHWYGLAVAGNTSSFLANFDYAAITMRLGAGDLDAPTAARVEASLQSAIRLNPDFAPAYGALASLKAERHEDLDDAYRFELQAISLDPNQFSYRYNASGILAQQRRYPDALAVLQRALPLATSPEEKFSCEQRISQIQEFQAQSDAYSNQLRARVAPPAASAAPPSTAPSPGPPALVRRTETAAPAAVETVLSGTIASVRCQLPLGHLLDLDLRGASGVVTLHVMDFAKVPLGTDNFDLPDHFSPCTQLTGLRATVRAAGDQIVSMIVAK
ncbi:MAG TPA: DUF1570 domain-containing protein [Terriglobales bacterium]|nr:DUF1570 domain-containing protein [Terriglobales bacterium]